MQRLKEFLKGGFLALIPIAIIIFFGGMTWDMFNLLGMKRLERVIGIEIPYLSEVVSFLAMLSFIIFLGWIISSETGKKIILLVEEKIFHKIPFIGGTIYFTKNVVNNNMPVIVGEYPSEGLFALGFLTNELNESLVAVYFPSSPVVSTGFPEIAERSKIELLNMKGTRGIEFCLSFASSLSKEEKKEFIRAVDAIKSRSKQKRRIKNGKDDGRMA